MSLEGLALLARSPRAGVDRVLVRPSVVLAFVLLVVATVTSTLVAARVGGASDVNDLFFAGTRQPLVQAMIDSLGPQRTAVVLYLIQRSFDAVVVATAFSPLFYWLLGSTAIHAAARLAGARRPFAPLLLLFAYATALTLVPANVATLALGVGSGFGPQVASLVSVACLVWLLLIAHRAIQSHYAVGGERALRILVVAVVVFYLVPLVLIVGSAVAIVIAAVVLEYF
ncbi:MAG TPA: YIP1 family protein [Candidatus Limnocylindria bacterium]|nr:YIP1 family protein [Candidatus Limnocylindria bacterium]